MLQAMRSRARSASLAPPIISGTLLILVTLVLTVLWNVAVVTDWFHRTFETSRLAYWAMLGFGYLLFAAIIAGLVVFIVSLARQIRLNQRQQNFIDSVTHELKSPLTSLKLHLETMQLRTLPPDVQAEFTRLMLSDVERLNALIDHVLEAAHVDAKRDPARWVELALEPQLAEAIALVTRRHNLGAGAITLEADLLIVRTDPAALAIVLSNLLDNAVEYSTEVVAVKVRAYAAGEGEVAIAISDTGVGLARNQLRRIFHLNCGTVSNNISRFVRSQVGMKLN